MEHPVFLKHIKSTERYKISVYSVCSGCGPSFAMAQPELACVYAALILNDDGIEISADKLNKLLSAAGVKLESYWVDLFSEYFKSHDIGELVKGTALGGAAPAAGGAAGGAAPAEEKQEEKKKEEEETAMDIGGFDDLFG